MRTRTTLRKLRENQGGFTLIELLVVIGILAILLAITLIAINPSKHFQDTRNAQRSSDVSAILNSIYEYQAANSGSTPPTLDNVTGTAKAIGGVSMSPTSTTFSTPNLTFTGLSSNPITSGTGTVTVENCANAGNNGTFPFVSGTASSVTVTNAAGVATDTDCDITGWSDRINICADVVPTYLANLPLDPASTDTACTGNFDTGYTITTTSGRFTIAAPLAEGSATISVTR